MRDLAVLRTTAEWEELMLAIDVPHTAFAKLDEVAEQPHLKAVEMFPELDHQTEGKIRKERPPARFSACPAGINSRPTRMGEHKPTRLEDAGHAKKERGCKRV